jgi:hypothetical protein
MATTNRGKKDEVLLLRFGAWKLAPVQLRLITHVAPVRLQRARMAARSWVLTAATVRVGRPSTLR